MAGKVTGKNAVIVVDDSAGTARTISTAGNAYTIEQDAGKIDVTGFGEGSTNFIPGLPVYGVSMTLKFDATSTTGAWTVLKSIFGSTTSKTVSITPESGGQTFSGEFMLDGLNVTATPTGDIQIGQVHFSVMGSTAPAWA